MRWARAAVAWGERQGLAAGASGAAAHLGQLAVAAWERLGHRQGLQAEAAAAAALTAHCLALVQVLAAAGCRCCLHRVARA